MKPRQQLPDRPAMEEDIYVPFIHIVNATVPKREDKPIHKLVFYEPKFTDIIHTWIERNRFAAIFSKNPSDKRFEEFKEKYPDIPIAKYDLRLDRWNPLSDNPNFKMDAVFIDYEDEELFQPSEEYRFDLLDSFLDFADKVIIRSAQYIPVKFEEPTRTWVSRDMITVDKKIWYYYIIKKN